ncbi:MAG: TonB-dependent receptor, partial [Nitrospinota bacterium]|nr:TonB-dependent receptor [Nitrospinota bacterium]
VFEEATEIATKSKLNADYVPGMVTVLHGKDLQARGFKTVWEALALVPGFDATFQSNSKKLTVRGIGDVFASGDIKIMLNSVAMNTNLSGESKSWFEFPIALVDRIEVIRGPGSAVHGGYAYIGVVNVITRKEGNQVYGRTGSFETYSGGASYTWNQPEDEISLSFNVAGLTSAGAGVQSGPDALFGTPLEPFSRAPGPSNEAHDNVFSDLHFNYKDFSFSGQVLHGGWGSGFGVGDTLPFPRDDIVERDTTYTFEARQEISLGSALTMELNAGWWENRVKWDYGHQFLPPNPLAPNGVFGAPALKERRGFGGIDFVSKGWGNHLIRFGWSTVWSRIVDASFTGNFQPSNPGVILPAIQTFRGSEALVRAKVDRVLNSVTLQDEYHVNQDIGLTLGLRWDHYDDVGDRLTPRIAGVYRLTDHHIIKLQYAQAFRPPTFLEMYTQNNPIVSGNPNIRPATIDTLEAGYIYKGEKILLRSTLFYSELDDLIIRQGGQYLNSGGAIQHGLELELEQEITSRFKLTSNLTLIETEDRVTNEHVEGSANLLANFGVNYLPIEDLMFNVQYRYVGHRHRAAGDTREELGGYNNVDFTANWFKPFGGQGWTLRGGVRNLFDEDIYYAAPANTYPADYPSPGISFWAQLSYEF